MDISDLITIKDLTYLGIGLLLGFIVSVFLYKKTEVLYLRLLVLFGKATYGTYIKVSIYNPLYDDRDPMAFNNSGVNNGTKTYELTLPYRYIQEDKLDIPLEELDQQIIESINNKYRTSYSTRYTRFNIIKQKSNQIFKMEELDRKRYK